MSNNLNNPATSVSVNNFPATQPVSGMVSVDNFPVVKDVNLESIDPGVVFNVASDTVAVTLSQSTTSVTDAASVALIGATPARQRIVITNSGETSTAGAVYVSLSGTAIDPTTASAGALSATGAHILYPGGSWSLEGYTGPVSAIAVGNTPAFIAVTEW